MAHTKQQRKRIRQDSVQKVANITKKTQVKSAVKKFDAAVVSGDKATLAATFKEAMSELARKARQGILTKGAASRKVSRMAAKIRTSAKA
ncbi:MAG: 30S ribosomal protein S20 [Alphaproteobacteria bacterium CG_4_10_14_0_8_um_filter_53_9]|nr:MAG: 30S ribosomal protein S20 [Alphaproteobacteria bacterium CG_4_10_14_0_8_um_filter_53_9]